MFYYPTLVYTRQINDRRYYVIRRQDGSLKTVYVYPNTPAFFFNRERRTVATNFCVFIR